VSELEQLLGAGGPLIGAYHALNGRLKAIFGGTAFDEPAFVSARMTTGEWEDLLRRTPLVALGWGGVRPKENTGKSFQGSGDWTVFVAVKNSGGPAPGHVGDAGGHGVFHMVQAAIAGLHGMVVRDIGTVMVKGASNLVIEGLTAEHVVIVGIDLDVACNVPPVLDRDLFLTVQSSWKFPGEPAEPIPLPFEQSEAPPA